MPTISTNCHYCHVISLMKVFTHPMDYAYYRQTPVFREITHALSVL
jgi:hypothetical protein